MNVVLERRQSTRIDKDALLYQPTFARDSRPGNEKAILSPDLAADNSAMAGTSQGMYAL
jgi:hypothetical protein